MSEIQAAQIVQLDQGGINARILAREVKVDFRRIEAASIKIPVRFTSAEGKRFFLRWFNSMQVNLHFISVIARTRLEHADIEKIESLVRTSLESATQTLNQSLDGAEELFKKHGVTSQATYDVVALEIQAAVLSSLGRRFLDALCKFDQLMPLLQTLEIHEIISTKAVDIQRAGLKREIRGVANTTRRLAMGLQRRMNQSFDTQTTKSVGVSIPDSTTSEVSTMNRPNSGAQLHAELLREGLEALHQEELHGLVPGSVEVSRSQENCSNENTGSSETQSSFTSEELRELLAEAPGDCATDRMQKSD